MTDERFLRARVNPFSQATASATYAWDEFQHVDAAQLRLIKLLAAPEDNLFVVGDDDQP